VRLKSWLLAPTLRGRLARITALAVFFSVAASGGAVYGVTSRLLRNQLDDELRAGPGVLAARLGGSEQILPFTEQACSWLQRGEQGSTDLLALFGAPSSTVIELGRPDGTSCAAPGARSTGVTAEQRRAAARGGRHGMLSDTITPDGDQMRVLISPLGQGWTFTVGKDASGIGAVVHRLRGIMLVMAALAALAAALAGWLVARAGLRPIGALAAAAEHIARTQDLSVRIEVPRMGAADEVTRFAEAFDRMTAALSAARQRQAQLVADAGHELRTPLTSLRTNIDLLVRSDAVGRPLPEQARAELLADVRLQLEELSELVDEVVLLAAEEPQRPCETVRWDDVVRRAVARVQPRAPGHVLATALEPWTVTGADPSLLERAVVNVLDNAVKFAPAGSTVRVSLDAGRLVVDDQGPGVPVEDRSQVFERFWRSAEARAVRGSGLGLAIVADVVAAHGGTVTMGEAPDGGARVTIGLPGSPPAAAEPAAAEPAPEPEAEPEAEAGVEPEVEAEPAGPERAAGPRPAPGGR